MENYILLILSCIGFSMVHDFSNQKIIRCFNVIFVFIALVILPALRNSSVGTDSEMYVEFLKLNYTIKDWLLSGIEIGNSLVLGLYSSLHTDNYFFYFMFYAFFTNLFFVSAIKCQSRKILFPLIIFLFYGGMYFIQLNNMRQTLAVAIFAFSIKYLNESEYKKYYLMIALASLFHYSAALLLILPTACNLLNRKLKATIFLTVLVIIIISIISTKLYTLAGSIPGLEKFSKYSDVNIKESGSKIFLFSMLLFMPTLLFVKFKDLQEDRAYLISFYFCCITLVMQFCIAFLGLSIVGLGRLYQYFIFANVIYYPRLINKISPDIRVLVYFLFPALLFGYLFVYMAYYNLGDYLPYKINYYMLSYF